jgi:hypothetical protein
MGNGVRTFFTSVIILVQFVLRDLRCKVHGYTHDLATCHILTRRHRTALSWAVFVPLTYRTSELTSNSAILIPSVCMLLARIMRLLYWKCEFRSFHCFRGQAYSELLHQSTSWVILRFKR